MKKLIFLLIFACISLASYAQEGFKVGVSFGPAFNSQRVEVGGVSTDSLKFSGLGYRLGLEVMNGFNENVSFYTGLALVQKGVKSGEVKNLMSVLEVPVGLKMRSNEISSGIRAGGLFAPTLDLRLSSKSKLGDLDVKTTDQTRFLGAGVKIGAVVDKELDFGTAMLMLAYNISLGDASKSDFDVTKNNYFQISFGFIF